MTPKSDGKFEKFENLPFDWSLSCKEYNVWPKKIQRSYLSRHQKVMKNLKEDWLVVLKMTWRILQFFTRALKVSKLRLWWDPFIQSWKCMSLKFTWKLCAKITKNDAKFKKELNCQFKINMRNLMNFDSSTQ